MKRRILIVEDDMGMVATLRELLSDEFLLFFATSADAALALIQSIDGIEVLITDFNLCGSSTDGADVVHAMRARFPNAQITMMSGDSPALPRIAHAISLPGVRFMSKPFRAADLKSAVGES